MARYFFHIGDGNEDDLEGIEFASDHLAIKEGRRAFGKMLKDAAEDSSCSGLWVMRVVTERGKQGCRMYARIFAS
jgi:hypothetical protein